MLSLSRDPYYLKKVEAGLLTPPTDPYDNLGAKEAIREIDERTTKLVAWMAEQLEPWTVSDVPFDIPYRTLRRYLLRLDPVLRVVREKKGMPNNYELVGQPEEALALLPKSENVGKFGGTRGSLTS